MNFAFHAEPAAEWYPPTTLEALVGTDAGFLEELVHTFREDMVKRLARLRSALRLAEMEGLRAEAHSIKGEASQIGAGGLAQIAQKLELSTGETVTVDVLDQVSCLQTAFHEVSYAMARYFAGPAVGAE
ncbi:MAG: Hpt domain-containing protein [Bryobacteraceae bacterium]